MTNYRTEIGLVWRQVRPPRDGDLGSVEAVHYFVEGGCVHLCDEAGKPTGTSCALGDSKPHQIAHRIASADHRSKRGDGDFNRQLARPPSRLAITHRDFVAARGGRARPLYFHKRKNQ